MNTHETQESQKEYRPEFSLSAEGKDITKAIQQSLIELRLTDNGGATAKTDELQITLQGETLPLPPKGARLKVALGFNGALQDKGWFVVNGVGSSGPPRKLVVYATAAPMNSEKQIGNVQSHKTRSWNAVTLGDIVKTVASEHGLKPRITAKLSGILISHLDQIAESDANLLTRLARTYNAVSKPSGGYWLFLEQGQAASASGKALAEIELKPSDVSNWSYSEGQRGAASASSSGDSKKEQGKIGVAYYDEQTGQTRLLTQESHGPDISNAFTQPEKSQAAQQAVAKKTQVNRNQQRMNLSGPCRPWHLPLTAEARIITQGFGDREDRRWLIESMIYQLSAQGMTVDFSLAVDLKPASSKGKKKDEKPKGPDYFG
ncbi:contractile injection system protein, VgrG/Pvc8 family [Rouxiella sp. T17]|uniref:contractile injection system protein, VgrG/Pvc8 family n=1 Tax=Rouxiella sp. T17 TaxID=3085684 RepID=UPI002FC5DB53